MADRLTKEQINKIKDKYNVSRYWSWSRVNTFMTSPFEYYLKYVKHVPEDRQDCGYTTLGSLAHDTLDDFYEGKIKYEDMIDQFEDGWITAIDIADLKLDRNDIEHDNKIKDKYRECLEHFFRNHTRYEHKLLIEKPMVAKIGNNVFIGYIDALYKDDNDDYHIVDFKTSSIYSGKTLEEHSGQLTIYAIGLMQAGVPLNKIKCCFNFLKYCTIQYEQKNGTIKNRNVERCKIGESLQSNAKTWLKALGYEDEIDDYLKLLLDANSIEVLPEDVQEKYKITDCHVYIPLDQKLVDKWNDTIIATIHDIVLREKDYDETKSEMVFWDSDESVKSQSHYFSTLCGYSGQLHKPYGKFLQELENRNNGLDLFCGIDKDCKCDTIQASKVICEDEEIVDLSWLDEI